MKKFCILMVLIFLSASCVSTRQVDTLSFRLSEQEQKQRRMENKMSAIDQELARMSTEMETPMRATQANLWAEIEGLRTQTAMIQGQMEELQRMLKGARGEEGAGPMVEMSKQIAYLDSSVAMIASQLALDLGPRPGTEAQAALRRPELDRLVPLPDPDAPLPPVADDPARALYDSALQAFHDRNYAQARSMWDEFARTFPGHELVSNAIFWQGECYFQMEDYAQAVLAYQDVISKHKDSHKYPAAMLKQGVSFYRLGKDRAGALVLEDLLRQFPDLPESARARTILNEQGR